METSPPFATIAQPLPQGWTEHKTPQGRPYYFNAETHTSTYVRPVPTVALDFSLHRPEPFHEHPRQHSERPPKRTSNHDNDRPKSKHRLPGCSPWILVKTRLGRRFVHNPATGKSFWRFPSEVMPAVVQFDVQRRRDLTTRQRGNENDTNPSAASSESEHDKSSRIAHLQSGHDDETGPNGSFNSANPSATPQGDEHVASQSEEEVEYIEVVESDESPEDEDQSLQPGLDNNGDHQNLEFGLDDMDFQLAELEGAEDVGTPIASGESRAAFFDLLDDLHIDPYSTWETVLGHDTLMDDARYIMMPNTKARREAFDAWSTERIQRRKQDHAAQAKTHPRIPFLSFLEQHANHKLFWPEFRRKYKSSPIIRDATTLSDKERERLYRDFLKTTKSKSESAREKDLETLLQSIPASSKWHRSIDTQGPLPDALLCDLRFYVVKPARRTSIIRHIVSQLPSPDLVMTAEEMEALEQRQQAKMKQEAALHQRRRQVESERQLTDKNIEIGRNMLDRADGELSRALDVGKDGLRHAI